MEDVEFGKGGVPVRIVAQVYGKDACWVRAGIITGYLPIGKATRNGKVITSIEEMNSKYGRINYYVSPKKLYEDTGYIWKGVNQNGYNFESKFIREESVLDREA